MPSSRKSPTPIRKIALWGNFGTQNLGNECTLAAMRHNLRQRLPDAEQFCICPEPQDTELRHRIKAVPMRAVTTAAASSLPRPLRVLRRLIAECAGWVRAAALVRDADALIIVGTGIMTDGGEGALGFPYELFKWSLLTWLSGGHVLFVSVGVEEMTRPLTRFFLKAAFYLAVYRSCRDANSRHLMQAIGFSGDGDKVYPDVAFSLPTEASVVTTVRLRRRVVAIGIYNYRDHGAAGGDSALAYGAYVHDVCSIITWLMQRGYSVRVIIGDYAYDRTVVADVRAALLANGQQLEPELYADEPARSYEQLIEQIQSVDLVMASRFHNVLLSLMLGKPVLSMSYDAKNEELMNQVGLTRYCQALDELDVARLLDQFQELEQQAPTLRSSIRNKTSQFRVSLEEQYDLIQRVAS